MIVYWEVIQEGGGYVFTKTNTNKNKNTVTNIER